MAQDVDHVFVTVTCGICEARYTVEITWLDSVADFECTCGTHLMMAFARAQEPGSVVVERPTTVQDAD